ncbi:MAG: hypothetical protein DME34_02165 [Verrucomicrobia bacterium]|nr:MAG: hypothetical protein DME34_02165 [Verrucomicrobiota bacterium]
MADAESIREAVRARAPFSTWVGVVCLFFLFGVITLAIVGPAPRGDTYEQERAKKRADNLKAAREADAKELGSYGWIDKNKGVVRVPIARAMELTVAELSRQRPAPANPIAAAAAQAASPAPAGAAPPSPSASPAPQPTGTPKPISIAGPRSEAGVQPAAAVKPAGAEPGSQPGASSTPAASPQTSAAQPAVSPTPNATPSAPGSPLPVRGKTPPQSPSPNQP